MTTEGLASLGIHLMTSCPVYVRSVANASKHLLNQYNPAYLIN
ncbi:hypothetical protein F3P66_15615 [Agrobacterium fabrum]|uniref:Uncharacterized protein n=1 Tax=Agrobacterium fabrum (strain C58 / ATCC 33970) TaxID=176299 RepID=Q8U4U7_AGRFC|nr:hypothetical protein Atu8029 [Agrobacterium fabrum str. C58]QRM60909.1 hypothetical protein F3P66_15615 [Agrobacterium fabrum]TRB29817.1 hypothetical protein EXN51_08440 [Agrobacterium fabrum]